MPVEALGDELLIVGYDDNQDEEDKARTDAVVQQIEEGFEELEAENKIAEDHAIAETQLEQEQKIDEIIHEANEEAKRVID